MKKLLKNKKGITLIALVVTIIVLLILAGVSITTVYNGESLFEKASMSANKNKIAQIQEELELLKLSIMPGTLDDYMTRLQEEKEKYRIKEEDFEQLDEEHWTIVVEDRYEFLIYTYGNVGTEPKVSSRSSAGRNTSGNIIIEFQGEVNTGLLVLSEKKGTLTYPNTRIFSVTKNTSGGKLSVVSADDSIATASIEGNVITVTPKLTNKDGKRVVITVMSEPRGEYLRQKAKYTATINKGSITIEATTYEGEYDGQKHPALTEVRVDPEDAKVTYSIGEEGYTDEIPEVEMTGEYTVSIRAEREGFDTKEITKTVTINKQKNKPGNLTLSETRGTIKYPTEKIVTILNNVSNGELSVSTSDESVATATLQGNTITITPKAILEAEKEITITVKAEATENYEEQIATYEGTVIQGSITLEVSPYKGVYDGSNHPAVTIDTIEPADTKLTYSINGGEESETIPQVTNADTYTITVKAEKAGYATKEITKTVTISKQGNMNGNTNANLVLSETSGTITYPTAKTITVAKNTSGGTLSVVSSNTSALTASLSGTTITLTPQIMTSTNTVTITVKSSATSNYEEQTATYTATVKQGTITISATPYSGTYDKTSHNALKTSSVTPNGCTVTYSLNSGAYSTTMPTVTNAGSYTVAIKATKPGYVTAETSKTASIAKASQNLTVNKTTVTLKAGATTDIDFVPSSGYGPAAVQYPTGATYKTTVYSWYVRVTGVASTSTSDWFNIYAQATDNYLESNKIRITVNLEPSGPPWTVQQAKEVLKKDGLKSHLGEQVLYSPSGGGTWRIFYYDTANYFKYGANTVFLKRDYSSTTKTTRGDYSRYTPTDGGTILWRMNPIWGATSQTGFNSSTVPNRNYMAWFCTQSYFSSYKNSDAELVIGGAPLEMFAKSYNVWKGSNIIVPNFKASSGNGYYFTEIPDQLESGPNGLYWQSKTDNYWLCSGASGSADWMYYANPNYGNFGADSMDYSHGLCPVVSIGRP